ncbi:hypothetical protein RF11_09062 [Thelohanellus kitauei]|uniref:Uncharacterized protein n=1 Tax=Thelohanellus kitauei TaxID=669202 RepID=A0A0C2J2Y2_THEKT|nr:hypothetical protein RF11_09062 [Thelohanellus kitauei]
MKGERKNPNPNNKPLYEFIKCTVEASNNGLIPGTGQLDQVKRYQNAESCCDTIQNLDATQTINVDMNCGELVPRMWGCFEIYMFPATVGNETQAVSGEPEPIIVQPTDDVGVQETSAVPAESFIDELQFVLKRRTATRRKVRTVESDSS